MLGRRDVAALQQRLDAAFARAGRLASDDLELRADFAKYLCVPVSGFVETAVGSLARKQCQSRASPTVNSYADQQISRLQNLKGERLAQSLGSFSSTWDKHFREFADGRRWDALSAVVDLRNKIAHGETVTLTYSQIREYCEAIKEIVSYVVIIFD